MDAIAFLVQYTAQELTATDGYLSIALLAAQAQRSHSRHNKLC